MTALFCLKNLNRFVFLFFFQYICTMNCNNASKLYKEWILYLKKFNLYGKWLRAIAERCDSYEGYASHFTFNYVQLKRDIKLSKAPLIPNGPAKINGLSVIVDTEMFMYKMNQLMCKTAFGFEYDDFPRRNSALSNEEWSNIIRFFIRDFKQKEQPLSKKLSRKMSRKRNKTLKETFVEREDERKWYNTFGSKNRFKMY